MTCPGCGGDNEDGARFCRTCGRDLAPAAPAAATAERPEVLPPGGHRRGTDFTAYPTSTYTGPRRPNRYSVWGIVCGLAAFAVCPVLVGPVGIWLGMQGRAKNERLATAAIVVSIVGTIGGLLVGLWVTLAFVEESPLGA